MEHINTHVYLNEAFCSVSMSILSVGKRYAAWRASPSTPGRRICDTSGSLSLSRCPSAKVKDWRSAAGLKERRWLLFNDPSFYFTCCLRAADVSLLYPPISWALLKRQRGPPSTTWWSPCLTSWMLAQVETWLHTSKWERRTTKEKRWEEVWETCKKCEIIPCCPFWVWRLNRRLFQGVTHQQWYLFNDFLIEPIDKVRMCPRWLCAHEMMGLLSRSSIVLSLQRPKLLSLTWAGRCPPFCITPRGTTTPNTTSAVSVSDVDDGDSPAHRVHPWCSALSLS